MPGKPHRRGVLRFTVFICVLHTYCLLAPRQECSLISAKSGNLLGPENTDYNSDSSCLKELLVEEAGANERLCMKCMV